MCSLINLFIFIFSFHFCIVVESTASLYSPDDSLWELDSTNFQRIIYRKNNVWLVQFYNSWCGHCIRFAPTWKAFARDIQNWRNVVDVAVVNCAQSENVKLCRDFDIGSYPTIRTLWTNVNASDKGEAFSGPRDILTMQQSVIKFLESNWNKGVPTRWPTFQPVNASNAEEIWSDVPENSETVVVFVEAPDSFIGKEVILDLSMQKHLTVRRVLSTNEKFLNSLALDSKMLSFPLLLRLRKPDEREILYRFFKDDNSTFVRDKVFELLVGNSRMTPQTTLFKKQDSADKPINNAVYMVDLENALHNSFKQEIGVQSDISGDKLLALKAFISALRNYFPGKAPIMAYLTKLNNWTSHRKGNVTGEDFLNILDRLQDESGFLPKMREWVGCRGSDQRYRGYPCSLWTLFHTLTVQSFDMYEGTHMYVKDDAIKVLLAIKGYVTYFFTCKECSQHFQMMAKHMEIEVNSPRDAVLWLWKAHNRVNKRLSGDITEDPLHPKVQFPPKETCPRCRITMDSHSEINWDKAIVLRYLQHFYGKQNILEGDHLLQTSHTPFPDFENMPLEDTSVGKRHILSPIASLLVLLCVLHQLQVQLVCI